MTDFVRSGRSFAERVGEPDEFDAAMGKIALSFSFLEETARNVILLLSGAEYDVGRILTAELSFRLKLEAIGSLSKHHLAKMAPDEAGVGDAEQMTELIVLCFKAEQLRNIYFHSSYGMERTRTKVTAKGKHGLKVTVEPVDSALLLDVADFIYETAYQLQLAPLVVNLADTFHVSPKSITYSRDGKELVTYRFGE